MNMVGATYHNYKENIFLCTSFWLIVNLSRFSLSFSVLQLPSKLCRLYQIPFCIRWDGYFLGCFYSFRISIAIDNIHLGSNVETDSVSIWSIHHITNSSRDFVLSLSLSRIFYHHFVPSNCLRSLINSNDKYLWIAPPIWYLSLFLLLLRCSIFFGALEKCDNVVFCLHWYSITSTSEEFPPNVWLSGRRVIHIDRAPSVDPFFLSILFIPPKINGNTVFSHSNQKAKDEVVSLSHFNIVIHL